MTTATKTPADARAANLVVTVRSAVASMVWLTASDQALVEAVVSMAQTIEDAQEHATEVRTQMRRVMKDSTSVPQDRIDAARRITEAEAQVQAAVRTMGPRIVEALVTLGGSPMSRKEIGEGGEKVGSRLAALRGGRAAQPA